ncbi:N-acetylmuramoyl-L-alanine amidase [Streptomyces sp. 549]|uniref:N-acetylmuramoyl-L-alanine amidase n=1 Tax=Streptomyces sp. 549 TaxID=3049076 RepID=UPI0024C23699|nr:N-acetylmuramoyl-L-alanine amidase [Streptomyces sp. 549]MDK1473619.1 N-acetylmuramoyl-L-alanine amidase [Streptomyces sp. 549]
MAPPLTPTRILAALEAEGLTVVEVGQWRTHTRTAESRPWGEVHGVMLHHTVTQGTAATVRICRDGYAGLPGPLCHGVIDKAGRVHMVGSGRTNHAGGGDPRVLAQVRAESYGVRPSASTRTNANGVDGNRHFYGFECENLGDGRDPWPEAQVEAMVRASTAICRAHTTSETAWGAKSVVGHLEWQKGKVDPRPAPGGSDVAMPELRARVAERLEHPAGWNPGGSGPAGGAYVVKRGDGLYRIATAHGLTLAQLIDLNPQLIHPGDELRISEHGGTR